MNRKIGKRILIIDVDFSGVSLIIELRYNSYETLIPIALIDNDKMRIGTKVDGVPIVGGIDETHKVVCDLKIATELINLPRVSHKYIGKVFDIKKENGVNDIKNVPRIDEYQSSVNRIEDFKQIAQEDLLSREPVKKEFNRIEDYFRNKTNMVTGAVVSIGSEIFKQLTRFQIKLN